MKTLLSLTVLFAMFSFTHLNANTNQDPPTELKHACMDKAWEIGTQYAGMFGMSAYQWTDWYYTNNCL